MPEALYARSIAELRETSDDELVAAHDQLTTNTVAGVDYYLTELDRRRADRQAKRMLQLTWVVTGLTVVNVVAVILALFG